MANNYVQFSETIDGLTPKEVAWWTKELKRMEEGLDPYENSGRPCGMYVESDDGDGSKYLWLVAEDVGDVDVVVDTVQRFLRECRPDECFTLTWAETCSKMRIGEFYGGGVFVTADGPEWAHALEFVRDKKERWEARRARGDSGGKGN